MLDSIAAFVFAHATLLLPLVIAVCVAGIGLAVRRWPATLGRRIASSALIIALVLVGAFGGGLLYAQRVIRGAITHRVADLTLYPRDSSRVIRLTDFRGRVVLVNFWATWCPPCRAEMPDLNRLSDEYRRQPVAILAITDETPDRIALYEQKITPLRMTVATFHSHPPAGAISRVASERRAYANS